MAKKIKKVIKLNLSIEVEAIPAYIDWLEYALVGKMNNLADDVDADNSPFTPHHHWQLDEDRFCDAEENAPYAAWCDGVDLKIVSSLEKEK